MNAAASACAERNLNALRKAAKDASNARMRVQWPFESERRAYHRQLDRVQREEDRALRAPRATERKAWEDVRLAEEAFRRMGGRIQTRGRALLLKGCA